MDTSSSETREEINLQTTAAESQDINNYEQQLSKCGEDIFRDRLSQNFFHNNAILTTVFFILILSGV